MSILCDPELKEYYQSRAYLSDIQQQNEKIETLTQEYEAQIALVELEPNILERLGPLTFGRKPQAPDTAFPQADNQTLRYQTEALLTQIQDNPAENPVPVWLEHVLEPKIRRGLFCAGAGLIMITFIFFASSKESSL